MDPADCCPLSAREHYARRILREKLAKEANEHRAIGEATLMLPSGVGKIKLRPGDDPKINKGHTPYGWHHARLPRAPDSWKLMKARRENVPPRHYKVCIIGAGLTGLYTALILDWINGMDSRFHVLINYDLLEASDRSGGRVFTYREFGSLRPRPENPYYDVGVSKFYRTISAKRTFDLFERLGLSEDGLVVPCNEDNRGDEQHPIPTIYNDIVHNNYEPSETFDAFQINIPNEGPISSNTAKRSKGAILNNYHILGKWKKALRSDFDDALSIMMHTVDKLSVRDYIQRYGHENNDFETLNWLESYPGEFDLGFSEFLLQSFDAEEGFIGKPIDCVTIKGGCSLIIDRMVKLARTKPSYRNKVTAIALSPDKKRLAVTVNRLGSREKQTCYNVAFSTIPLGCLQKIDLSKASLSAQQKIAIRSIKHLHSCKVAIVFEEAWWTKHCSIVEGTALTDLPIGCVIYPSYNALDEGRAVLIASLTYSENADRLGAWMKPDAPSEEFDGLIVLILENLARLHQEHGFTLEKLRALYVAHHAFNWSTYEHASSGTVAQYGPGQFQNFYPSLVIPAAKSKLFFTGDAVSANHGTVAGALNSSLRGLMQWLAGQNEHEILEEVRKEWGMPGDVEGGENGTLHLIVALGHLEPNERFRV